MKWSWNHLLLLIACVMILPIVGYIVYQLALAIWIEPQADRYLPPDRHHEILQER